MIQYQSIGDTLSVGNMVSVGHNMIGCNTLPTRCYGNPVSDDNGTRGRGGGRRYISLIASRPNIAHRLNSIW